MVLTNKIRIASDLDFDSIVDGPGLRCVLWTQGCPHHCGGCHNPQTHDEKGGYLVDTKTLIEKIKASNLQSGLTLSGGEPFLQAKELLPLVVSAKEKGWNIWAFSGFLFEELMKDKDCNALLNQIDVLVDGKFILDQKDFRLAFKGSKNQRIIDIKKTLQEGKVILHEVEKENKAI